MKYPTLHLDEQCYFIIVRSTLLRHMAIKAFV